jgi:predicted RecB family nuclease
MQYKHGKHYFSASDLTNFLQSPFASWMDRFRLECPDEAPIRDDVDAMNNLLSVKGYAHEERIETELKESVNSFQRIDGDTDEQKITATIKAIEAGVEVITQACFRDGDFFGYADFLVRVPGKSRLGDFHYEVWDAKLTKRAKPSHLIQLCVYVEMLDAIQGRKADRVVVVLGTGEKHVTRISDCYAYFVSVKQSFLAFHEHFLAAEEPDPAESKSWGRWATYAEEKLMQRDHLYQVANITREQIAKLNRVGVMTMAELALAGEVKVPGINPSVLEKLKAQASIQIKSRGLDVPEYRVIKPAAGERMGLALLPPHSDLDVFFDIEGYPLDDGGLEYLWGCTYFNESSERVFRDFWAHDREQEKHAFKEFVEWVYDRWVKDPSMHIYHYASYEITACRKLMSRYGICEYEVDQLLRNEVFVDLYKVVKAGILLGEPRYSIKNVEHLYRGRRETDVASGGESVVVYEAWRDKNAAGEEGDTWETSEILRSIRDYNIDDCDSTQELVDWLRLKQVEEGITYLGKVDVEEPEVKEEITARLALRDRLLDKAERLRAINEPEAQLTENLAWMLEFHRREAKPGFWRLFDRLGADHEELEDDLECLGNCYRTDRPSFKVTPKDRNKAYEYTFDKNQELKGLTKSLYLLGEFNAAGKQKKVEYVEQCSDLENGLIVLKNKEEPPEHISLIPDQHVNAEPIPSAVAYVVQKFEKGSLAGSAITGFLSRDRPRVKGLKPGEPLVAANDPKARLNEVIDIVRRLDNSYLPIQGPPGTGKSYTAKYIIAELIKDGAKIGITSNSHKAINHLITVTVEHCRELGMEAQFTCAKDPDAEMAALGVFECPNNELRGAIDLGWFVGATAWGFSRDDVVDTLDYLFVDEAGQVSVANLVGMSRSAKNLVLMGDQMQLGQPSQGVHPGESGLSVLDYLMHEMPTIPPDRGVFLGTTFRMHERVNAYVSEQVYESKLHSDPSTNLRTLKLEGALRYPLREAGIVYWPVEHQGNSQSSMEEVEVVVDAVKELLKQSLSISSESPRLITLKDILFVAPYNHQVRKLQEALGVGAKVGSVDKFQGQEAPIVILSLCSSDAMESPRGIEFLFNRQRLNVAVSRAQSLVIVVGSPALIQCEAKNITDVPRLNMVAALFQAGEAIHSLSTEL